MSFLHGIRVSEIKRANRSISVVATAVIGLVASGPAADAAAFPLDTPVKVTDIDAAIAKAGATGTLAAALRGVASGLKVVDERGVTVRAEVPVVVVRIQPGADAAATNAKVIGADAAGVRTGMQALLAASAQLGVQPRIIGAPGLETEPVALALAALAKKLRAMTYVPALGADKEAAIAYRDKFSAREAMLLWPGVTAPFGAAGASIASPVAAHAMGLRAAIDATQGWHKTLSNVPVADIDGLSASVGFDVQDATCDANVLNAAGITTLVRLGGELRFWGNRTTAAADSDFVFESATRTAQILADSVAVGLVWALDKPLVPSLARDIVERINSAFDRLKRDGFILGAAADFEEARNPVADLKAGKVTISYRYTFVPPLEALGLEQEISDEFFADFGALATAG